MYIKNRVLFSFYFKKTVFTYRSVKLRNLISLWQIRIKIIFPWHFKAPVYIAFQSQSRPHRKLHSPFVHRRKSSGISRADRTEHRIFLLSEGVFTGAVHFCFGQKLNMYLKTYYRFKLSAHFLHFSFPPRYIDPTPTQRVRKNTILHIPS